jgi:hypothetical protein
VGAGVGPRRVRGGHRGFGHRCGDKGPGAGAVRSAP